MFGRFFCIGASLTRPIMRRLMGASAAFSIMAAPGAMSVQAGQNYSVVQLGIDGSANELAIQTGGTGCIRSAGGAGSQGDCSIIGSREKVAGTSYLPAIGKSHAFYFDGSTNIDLGSLTGPQGESTARAVSGAGHVVGTSTLPGNRPHAFLWTKAKGMVDLGDLGGGTSDAFAVNDAGQVVGESYVDAYNRHAFIWTESTGMVDLGTLNGGSYSWAIDINSAGLVVGSSHIQISQAPLLYQQHIVSWTESAGMVDLGAFEGFAEAQAVNDAGRVVGYSYRGSREQSTLYADPSRRLSGFGPRGDVEVSVANRMSSSGQIVGYQPANGRRWPLSFSSSLSVLTTGFLSEALSVNASGKVVGYYSLSGDCGPHGFSWEPPGNLLNLGVLAGGCDSRANDINASGLIVGGSSDSTGTQRATIWTETEGVVDLNQRIPTAPRGLFLTEAVAVSDGGKIVAKTNNGFVLLGASSNAPLVGPISATSPVAKSVSNPFSVTFTDADANDTHTATWSWGDGSPDSTGVVTESKGSGSAANAHGYQAAGVYHVTVKITDSAGLSASSETDVVVYDPSTGFVAGDGWFNSPAGALRQDPSLVGRARFEFVSRYKNGRTVPTGETEFGFRAGGVKFESKSYDWLLVAGCGAKLQGTGKLNDVGPYKFSLNAIDGALFGCGRVDRLRMKIWSVDATGAEVVVYDNGVGANTEGTPIRGGNIMIRK